MIPDSRPEQGKILSSGSAGQMQPRNVVALALKYMLVLQRSFRRWHGNLAWMISLVAAMEALPEIIASTPCRDREARRLVARQTRHWRRDKLEIDRIRLGMQYHALARQGVDPVELLTARMALAGIVAQIAVLDWIRSRPVLPDDRRRRVVPSDDAMPDSPEEHGLPEARGPPGKEKAARLTGCAPPDNRSSSTPSAYADRPRPATSTTWVHISDAISRALLRLGVCVPPSAGAPP